MSKSYRNLLTIVGVLVVVAVTAAGGSYAAKANASVVANMAAKATKAPTISCKSSKAPTVKSSSKTPTVKSSSKNPTVKRSKAPKSTSVPCVGGPVTESPSAAPSDVPSEAPSDEPNRT